MDFQELLTLIDQRFKDSYLNIDWLWIKDLCFKLITNIPTPEYNIVEVIFCWYIIDQRFRDAYLNTDWPWIKDLCLKFITNIPTPEYNTVEVIFCWYSILLKLQEDDLHMSTWEYLGAMKDVINEDTDQEDVIITDERLKCLANEKRIGSIEIDLFIKFFNSNLSLI